MIEHLSRLRSLAVLLMFGLLTAACTGVMADSAAQRKGSAGPGYEQAGQIARNALAAYNSGDYRSWTRDWSPAMKAAIKERDFQALRDSMMDRYGGCSAISDVVNEPSPRPGYVRWAFTVECQSGRLKLVFAFPQDGNRVQSVYLEAMR